ncbi:hypothetical protein [Pseudomonas sp. St29]|nr:hypothetical protein [Pseudomonas sp. St29]
MEFWKIERDNNFLQRDMVGLSEHLSSVFLRSICIILVI